MKKLVFSAMLVCVSNAAFADNYIKTGPSYFGLQIREASGPASLIQNGASFEFLFGKKYDRVSFDAGILIAPNNKMQLNLKNTSIAEANFSSYVAMASGHYDLMRKEPDMPTPYLSVGLGLASNSIGDGRIYYPDVPAIFLFPSHTSYSIAYKVGAGVRHEIKKDIELGLEYNFVSLGSASSGSAYGLENTAAAGALASFQFINNIAVNRVKAQQILLSLSFKL